MHAVLCWLGDGSVLGDFWWLIFDVVQVRVEMECRHNGHFLSVEAPEMRDLFDGHECSSDESEMLSDARHGLLAGFPGRSIGLVG